MNSCPTLDPVTQPHPPSHRAAQPAGADVGEERTWSPAELHRLLGRTKSVSRPKEVGFLAEGLAHDLNNALAPIVTTLEILQRCYPPDDRAQDLLCLSQRHARQGVALIQQVLSLAQGVDHAHSCIQPGSLVRDLHKHLKQLLPDTVNLQLYSGADFWPVLGSLAHLHRALLNFCLRARPTLLQGGTLTLSVENVLADEDYPFIADGTPPSRYVVFTIADNGPALDEDFEVLLLNSAEVFAEAGMANTSLAAAEAIVKAHHGHVLVSSEPGEGTAIKIYLPAAPGSASGEQRLETPVPRGAGECILVVDDEPGFLAVTQAAFEAFGYRVMPASNGAAAVAKYLQHQEHIALVLLDMTMPFMDGPETMRVLRHINPDIKIIATSGLNSQRQMARSAEAGVAHFLPKPCEVTDLLQLVGLLIQSPRSAA